MDWHQVVIRPLVTEKGTRTSATLNAYPFQVHPDANKIEIKRAIQDIFDVKVEDVRVVTMRGKMKRLGRFVGRRSSWKKAFVKLAQGEKLELFENV